ncbi:hypothetical protein CRG98_036447 [Punica granatum]|uniref:Uncharacterized protein n=1 Tax=Punica granatum TaxID=22663 RepID=A0A2I0IGL3_PUNGR|nr:hypothetical protein CRG98_036447 [Punica granatum]
MDSGSKSPLLTAANGGRRSGRLRRRNSVDTLRTDFVAKLPDKIRSSIDVDPESPYDIDFSKARGLSKGPFSLPLSLYDVSMNARVWIVARNGKS